MADTAKTKSRNNSHPWPSISHLGKHVAGAVFYYQESRILAAIHIQRWWRGDTQPQLDRKGRAILPSRLAKFSSLQQTLENRFAAYTKYDGTNVGKRSDGLLFGRNHMIMGDKYQSTSIDCMEAVDAQKVKDAICAAGDIDPDTIRHFVLYGELMTKGNQAKFDYADRGWVAVWFCFGAVVVPSNEEAAKGVAEKLKALGLDPRWDAAATQRINLPMTDALRVFVEDLPVAEKRYEGRLGDLIRDAHAEMMGNTGEGLVLVGPQMTLKWKSAKEDESDSYSLLEAALSHLEEMGLTPETDDFTACMKLLWEVSMSGRTPKRTMTLTIQSALSKYDAVETYFETGDMKTIMGLVIEEVTSDLNAGESAAVKKEIKSAVGKHIGASYKKWMASQKTCSNGGAG